MSRAPIPFTRIEELCLGDFGRHEFEVSGTYYPAPTMDEDPEVEITSIALVCDDGGTWDWTSLLPLLDPEVTWAIAEELEEEMEP
jgi:hypothetical protein